MNKEASARVKTIKQQKDTNCFLSDTRKQERSIQYYINYPVLNQNCLLPLMAISVLDKRVLHKCSTTSTDLYIHRSVDFRLVVYSFLCVVNQPTKRCDTLTYIYDKYI